LFKRLKIWASLWNTCQCSKLSRTEALNIISILHSPEMSSSHGWRVATVNARASNLTFYSLGTTFIEKASNKSIESYTAFLYLFNLSFLVTNFCFTHKTIRSESPITWRDFIPISRVNSIPKHNASYFVMFLLHLKWSLY